MCWLWLVFLPVLVASTVSNPTSNDMPAPMLANCVSKALALQSTSQLCPRLHIEHIVRL